MDKAVGSLVVVSMCATTTAGFYLHLTMGLMLAGVWCLAIAYFIRRGDAGDT